MYDRYSFCLLYSLGIHILFIIIITLSIGFTQSSIPEEKIITLDVLQVKAYSNVKTIVKQDNKAKPKKIQQISTTIKKESEKKIANNPQIANKDTAKLKDKQINNKSIKSEVKKIQHNLKNIAKKPTIIDPSDKKTTEALGKEKVDAELSISERQLIHDKIDQHWERGFLLGIKNATNIQITVQILLSYDGSLTQDPIIVNYTCPLIPDNVCNSSMTSVKRAVWKAFPIKGLSVERYNVWKEIALIFSPEQ